MLLKEHHIEAVVICFASFATIVALIYSFLFPEVQVLLLTVLTVLLAAIYQIGYNYAKQSIKAKNEQDFVILEEVIEQLEGENKILREK